jgi:predicted transcriptional regulator
MGIGIVDCKATWIPDYLIKKIAGNKARKFDSTILFDYDGKLRTSWGLKKNSYNVIILDKDRVCRAIVRGKITDEKQKELIQLIIDLQSKM